MPVTLTTNYAEIFSADTVSKIEELLDENYDLSAMIEFIDERDEESFVNYYEEYVRCGEIIGYDPVDLLIEEMGIEAVTNCDERFQGAFDSGADFAEYWVEEVRGEKIPDIVTVDWDETWDRNLYYDFTIVGEVGWGKQAYVFADR